MNGLELSREYFEEYGRPMLLESFPELMLYLCAGFVGSGSEHYGYDDETSRDHDFEPGFCIFIPDEDIVSRRDEFQLERAYSKLPSEYKGCKRQVLAPVGGRRNGIIRISEFYKDKVGVADGILSDEAWLRIPDYALSEVTNGEIFFDNYGQFTEIRKRLYEMPRDIWLKRLSGCLIIMAQAGQYNFGRCLKHGETDAAQLAIAEYVNAVMRAEFILSNRYMPYYKWSFRELRNMGKTETADLLSYLLSGDNKDRETASRKQEIIEEIAGRIIHELNENDLTSAICGDLEKHAYSVNDKILDSHIRNMSIFASV